MTTIPQSHIEDAHKLTADGRVMLYQLMPLAGGTIFMKSGIDYKYLDDLYEGLPVQVSGEKWSSDTSTPTPRMVIGQENVDLLPFKGLINDGYLDGAKIVRYEVLLEDMLNQVDAKRVTNFRVKRVEGYSRTKVTLQLSTFTGAINQSYPFRQYTPPAFPWVEL